MRGILVSILLLLATPAFAQFTSNVQGTITDSSGAVAVGATITLTNTDTNATQVFTTSKSGQYFFNRLAPGSYRVSAHLPGFKESVRVAQLTTEQTAGIDLQLSVGATTESVTVSAEDSHGINADETRLQYTLSALEISEMPLQNQATLGLLRAAPGATGVSENHLNVNVNQDQGSESANGRTNNSNLFVLDSIPIVSELAPVGGSGGAVDFVPHTDMIQEIALQTTTFSVENGASSGIQTSITTKSGGNRFHGDADYNYSGRPLEATPHPLTSAPPYRSQQVSGALGGPIWKDHTFFFGSYFNQQFAQVNSQNVEFVDPMFVAFAKTAFPVDTVLKGLVPVEATLRADLAHSKPTASGNLFAGLGGGDWIDNGACAAGSGVTPLVPCQIPVLSSSTFNTPQTVNGKQYNFRLDQNIRGGKDHAYISFFRDDQTSVSRRIYQSFDGETPSTGYYVAGNYTRVLSPTLSNQASFGQTRFSFNYTTTPQSTAQLELPYTYGPFEFGTDLATAFLYSRLEHQSYGRDNVSWVIGRHNLSLGFQGSYQNELLNDDPTYSRPFYESTFNLPAFLANTAQYELLFNLSAAATGQPAVTRPQIFGAGVVRFGLYGQDAWKVTPHLTVSYGLRWDNFGNPSAYGADVEPFANVKLGAGGDLRSQVSALSVGAVNNVYSSSRKGNFLPRGSVAYSLPHAGLQTVVRAGIGLYQDDLNLANVTANLPTQAPVRLSITRYPFSPYTFGNTTVHGPVGTLNPYGFQLPNIVVSSYSAKGAPLDASGNVIGGVNLYGADPDLKPQSVLIYNAGIEQEMPRKLVVGINYSGSHGYDQLLTSNVNTYTNRGSAPAINTDFGRITFFRNAGVSNYNALILTARQALGKLTYQTSYTWSKSLSDPTANLTDQYNVPSQYSYTAADVRQRFTLTQVYEVPSRFGSRYLNLALARWSLNNTLTTQSGTPFSLEAANQNDSSSLDYNNDGQLADIPLYTGTKRNFNRSDARKSITDSTSLFAAGSLVAPAVGSEGEGGKQYTFRGPGYFDLDSGVSKKIDLPWFFGEKATLSLRFQAINLLNTANFGNPDQELGDNTAGQVRAAYNSRKVQFGGRFEF